MREFWEFFKLVLVGLILGAAIGITLFLLTHPLEGKTEEIELWKVQFTLHEEEITQPWTDRGSYSDYKDAKAFISFLKKQKGDWGEPVYTNIKIFSLKITPLPSQIRIYE